MSFSFYIRGVIWFSLSIVAGISVDVLSKYLAGSLPVSQIIFLRFLFATVSLIPMILFKGLKIVYTSNISRHVLRALCLYISMSIWVYGLTLAPVFITTILSFTIPIFVLLLSPIFFDEKIPWYRYLATFTGLLGICIIASPNKMFFNSSIIILLISVVLFAILDILNKKMLIRESIFVMLFYSVLIATCLSTPIALYFWEPIKFADLLIIFILGVLSNLILFFLLKAFSLLSISALEPYRYIELPISIFASYVLFNDIPNSRVLYGTLFIIISTVLIFLFDKKNIQ